MSEFWILIALLIICVALSGFFSGAEIALSSLDKIILRRIIRKDEKRGRQIESLLKNPSHWLITILVGNNIVNITAASLATILVGRIVTGATGKIVGIVTGIMTLIILIFGEITPKRYCQQHTETVSLKIIGPIFFLSIVFYPLTKALTFITQQILKITGTKNIKKNHLITEKDIHALIDIGEEEGALDKEEEELVHSALEFDETQAKEIMIPRTKMTCIEEKASLRELINLIKKFGYSRIPVYRETIDNIVGVAYAKDLLNLIDKMNENLKVREVMHPPVFVPYTTYLSGLFHKLQRERTHLAIVVDEYGGVAGLLTIEDLLEEIVGEIEDEYDNQKEKNITPLKDGSFLVEADTNIGEINEELATHFPEETDAFESLGGFIFSLLGRIPKEGEAIKYENLKMDIIKADAMSIKKVKIWRMSKKTKESSEKPPEP
ncbi:HlyC/CorC family transporter [Candidatus Aerophobetes bacterium]|nr:HlyC/CorC family transporter [Candidatus Aerophobetes bacterium]